jgi:exodeoxyribonuclease V beta subunit
MTERLDVAALPLRGSRVIEASAGTGKTWTLAALVLRLVLGDGVERPLHPREILVMSFTKAATRELVERIRERLARAANAFQQPDSADAREDFVASLLRARPGLRERLEAAQRLRRAADAMDEAAVHTIDAWCQRVLREHAFDSGSRLSEEMLADETDLRRQAVRDWWRVEVYPLEADALAQVQATWKDVTAAEKSLERLLKIGDARVDAPGRTLVDEFTHVQAERAARVAELKQGWAQRVPDMLAWLGSLWGAKKDKPIDGRKLGAANATKWLQSLRDWALDPDEELPHLTDTARERLVPAGVAAALNQPLPIPPEFAAFEVLLADLEALPSERATLLRRAHAAVTERLATLKQRAASAGFADLQRRLADALDEGLRGDAARRLRAQLQARYPVALVDECQDSSPVQMLLFERVWGLGHDEPGRTLLLIGDPKQSIYRFRGADLQGFLRARRAAGPRVHSLDTNFRSTPELVDAVNAVFEGAERRHSEGAFRFGLDGSAGGVPVLPFERVVARGRADRIVVGTAQGVGAVPALTLALDRTVRGAVEARERLADACAEQIVAWLSDAQARWLPAPADKQPPRRLRPSDIAVLVRSKREADAVRAALAARRVRSVYLSDKDSVFAEPEAADLLRLLRAVAEPADGRAVRAALATAWVGLSLDELRALADDDTRFEAAVEQLLALRQVWRQQGVLAALRQALQSLVPPQRWQGAGAERTLTNTLHLAELLQTAAEALEGEAALLRWLTRAIDEAADAGKGDMAPEDQLLRLESDGDLVPIVTVHKSKGLQYRLVCVPFSSLAPGSRGKPDFVIRPARINDDSPGDGRRELLFAPDAAARAAEQAEEARESLRLLYVALTRAEHALWLGVAAASVGNAKAHAWQRSALGWLVSGDEVLDDPAVFSRIEAWAHALPHTLLLPLWPGADEQATAPGRVWADPQPLRPLRPPRPLAVQTPSPWAVGSYSGFVRGLESPPARGWRDDEARNGPADDDASAPAEPPQRAAPWHRFPRGAGPGQLLHTQLEWLADAGFALAHNPALATQLRTRLQRQAPEVDADDVITWLAQVCATPVPALGAPLAGLPRVWSELEFWLPTEQLDAVRVDALCRAHVLPGQERPPLPPRRLRGLLMGFADLVFQGVDGRYGVLDHKSNALGDDDAAYTDEVLAAAVLSHRYDVQGALYLVALHRLLRHRLGTRYVLAEQLHGAVFLFLRGVAAPGAGGWRLAPVPALIEGLDQLFAPPSPKVLT